MEFRDTNNINHNFNSANHSAVAINRDPTNHWLVILLLLLSFRGMAQVYPVQLSVVTTPPYYNYLSHLGDQNNHLQLIATFTDFASPPINVRFRFTIEGPGYVLRTRQDIPVGPLQLLTPGVPVFIQGSDVLPYLTENNLQLVSGNVDLENLPEGFTTVCAEAVKDGINGEVVSDKACTAFFLQYYQPPQSILPFCGTQVDTAQTFHTFQWSPPQGYLPAPGSDLTYTFSLYEWIDTTNFNIFQTGQGLVFQSQTSFTTQQVSDFDIAWQTGRKYVWRVQAQLSENGLPVQMILNNGISQPCSFYYGKAQSLEASLTNGLTINLTAEALASRKGRALWTVTDETPGEGLSSYTAYIVEYRRKPYEGETYIYNWLVDTVYAQQQPIFQLEPEKTYQVRVSGIAGDFVSEPSEISEFTTPPLRDYACGESDLPYVPQNYTPLLSAHMGDIFQIGQFELEVTTIEPLGLVGHYRGRGTIKHDFIGGAKVKVKFDDLLVDNQFVVREGMATAVTSGVDEWLHDQYAQFVEPVYVPGVIDSVYVTDSTAFAVVNGQVLTFQFDPPDYPIILQDDNGNQYTIYPGGTITVSTYLNVTDEVLGATAAMAVHFSENENDNYGFDKKQYMPWHANYEIIRLADSTNYFVANKSAVVRQSTVVNAVINTELFPPGTVEFKLGSTVLSSSVLNAQQGLIQVSIPAQSATGELAVYAYSDNVSLGKLNLFVYDAKPLNVVVVPVASETIDETALNNYLNTVFNEAGVNITATVETAFTTPEIGATTTIQVSDATLMRKYSPQMRVLRDAYFESHSKEDNTYYLFVVAGLTDSAGAQIDGYMVRGKQVGFIASGSGFVTYAHELGHGMGALQHSWLNNGPQQASTNNLMDYNDSTHLVKSQWEWLQDPPMVAGMWDEEEEFAADGPKVCYYKVKLNAAGNVLSREFWKKEKYVRLCKDGDWDDPYFFEAAVSEPCVVNYLFNENGELLNSNKYDNVVYYKYNWYNGDWVRSFDEHSNNITMAGYDFPVYNVYTVKRYYRNQQLISEKVYDYLGNRMEPAKLVANVDEKMSIHAQGAEFLASFITREYSSQLTSEQYETNVKKVSDGYDVEVEVVDLSHYGITNSGGEEQIQSVAEFTIHIDYHLSLDEIADLFEEYGLERHYSYDYYLYINDLKDTWARYGNFQDQAYTTPPVFIQLLADVLMGVPGAVYGYCTGQHWRTGEELTGWDHVWNTLEIVPYVGVGGKLAKNGLKALKVYNRATGAAFDVFEAARKVNKTVYNKLKHLKTKGLKVAAEIQTQIYLVANQTADKILQITEQGVVILKYLTNTNNPQLVYDMGNMPVKVGNNYVTKSVKIYKYGDEVGAVVEAASMFGEYSTKIDDYVSVIHKESLFGDDASTFLDGVYRTVEANQQITAYRTFGGNAKVGGTFVTTKSNATRTELALLDEWNNSMRFEATIKVPTGTKMNIGKVGSQTSTNGLQTLAGGGDQVILPFHWNTTWVTKIVDKSTGTVYNSVAEFAADFPNLVN